MTAIAPVLWILPQFEAQTRGSGLFTPGRGLLAAIDIRITAWNGGNCIGHRKKNLVRILGGCRYWLTQKQGKGTSLANLRRNAVNQLAQQAFARLQYERFETNKRHGANAHARPMQGGYMHERNTYLSSGKQTAYSGSTASALIKNAPSIGIAPAPDFATMNEAAFKQLIDQYAQGEMMETEVRFFTKQQRLGRMILARGGELRDGPNKSFDTSGAEWAWAMDVYGNLFSTNQNVEAANLPGHQRFNHSSLNAGKSVTCAGILRAAGGQLTYLDNASGHYKPTRQDVGRALQELVAHGYDFDKTVCGVRIMEQVHGNVQWSVYTNAKTLIANVAAPPDAVA